MGVHAFEDRGHAFERHLAGDLFLADAEFHLSGHGEIQEIGGSDAVDRGDKGNCDAAADLIDLIEVLHHLNQAEHGADDADGRRKAAGRLEHLGNLLFVLCLVVEFEFHDLA